MHVTTGPGGRFVPSIEDPRIAGPGTTLLAPEKRVEHIELLKPDIWFTPHNEQYDLEGKRKQAETQGAGAWVDPEGYRRFVAGRKRALEDEIDVEWVFPKARPNDAGKKIRD